MTNKTIDGDNIEISGGPVGQVGRKNQAGDLSFNQNNNLLNANSDLSSPRLLSQLNGESLVIFHS